MAHDDCNSLVPDIAIQRFLAAQWLVESGETERARRLLRWPDTPWLGWPWTLGYALSGPTFLSRARIEHSLADTAASRAYYQQFLRRYDRPMASLAPLVEEALEALSPRQSR